MTCTPTIIRPVSQWGLVDLRELWDFRNILLILVWRDIRVRYKQTILGATWAVLQPALTTIVFTIFFGNFGGMDKGIEQPYSIFVYVALLPWSLCATSVGRATDSIVINSSLVTKVYFPRLLLPLSSSGYALVDFCVSFAMLLVLLMWTGTSVSFSLLLTPLFAAGTLVTAMACGIALSALVVVYRDFRTIATFFIQLWMFVSPIAYDLEKIPVEWSLVYALNPIAGMVSGFRAAVFDTPVPWACVCVSAVSALALLFLSTLLFVRVERRFAEVI